MRSKFYCPNGHRYRESNIYYVTQRGKQQRRCKKCRAERDRRKRMQRVANGQHNKYQTDLRQRIAGTLPPGDKRHGTTNGYNLWSCRCDLCKGAMTEYHRKRREKIKDREARESPSRSVRMVVSRFDAGWFESTDNEWLDPVFDEVADRVS